MIQSLTQSIEILGLILAAGILLYLANELYYLSLGARRRRTLLITGMLGTPVHELSHALVATLFGMKVTHVAFYQPDPASRTLGFVNFRYVPNNVIHRAGLFFVGIAPLLGGGIAVEALMQLAGVRTLADILQGVGPAALSFQHIGQFAEGVGEAILHSPQVILFLLASVCIAAHSTPSRQDLSVESHEVVLR